MSAVSGRRGWRRQRGRAGSASPGGQPAAGEGAGGRQGRSWPSAVAGIVVLAAAVAVVVQAFLVRAVVVPSDAMRPTVRSGDRVLVDRLTLDGRAPARGEVVVVRRPTGPGGSGPARALRSFAEGLGLAPLDADVALIRRVVGLPGEVVAIRAGVLHIDGRALAEPYAAVGEHDLGPVTVPGGHYWLMGDNRSAAPGGPPGVGPVPRAALAGRALRVVWPPSRLGAQLHGEPQPAVRAHRRLPGVSSLDMLDRWARVACLPCAGAPASRRHDFAGTPRPPDRAPSAHPQSGGPR